MPPALGADGCSLPPRRIWQLTPAQIAATVKALFPDVPVSFDSLAGVVQRNGTGFGNEPARLEISQPYVDRFLALVDELVAAAVQKPAAFSPCLDDPSAGEGCVRTFVASFAPRVFRRPLEETETERTVALYTRERAAGNGHTEALAQVLRALLLSPSFLFRTELGGGGAMATVMTSHERASALSYALLDGPPDAALRASADSGALTSPAGLQRELQRLLAAPQSAQGLVNFLAERFRLDEAEGLSKNTNRYPLWNAALAAAAHEEPRLFIEDVLWKGDGRFATLLTANHSFVNATLAKLYGVTPPQATGFARVTFPSAERSGVLSQPALMALLANAEETDIVKRGLYVRERLLCQHLPAPPGEVNPVPPRQPGLTRKQQFDRHSSDPTCATCHKMMDPIGHVFETYDAIGRHRTHDEGTAIAPAGLVSGTSRGDIEVSGVDRLARALAELPEAQRCFVDDLRAYLVGATANEAATACVSEKLSGAFDRHGGNVTQTLIEVMSDETFFARTN